MENIRRILISKNEPYGLVMIFQGLYIGDSSVIKDLAELKKLKISNIVNTSAEIKVQNLKVPEELSILNLGWKKKLINLFPSYTEFCEFFKFVNKPILEGKSVLILSGSGKNRSLIALIIFLIRRFRWGFNLALNYAEYRYSIARGLKNNHGFISQEGVRHLNAWTLELGL